MHRNLVENCVAQSGGAKSEIICRTGLVFSLYSRQTVDEPQARFRRIYKTVGKLVEFCFKLNFAKTMQNSQLSKNRVDDLFPKSFLKQAGAALAAPHSPNMPLPSMWAQRAEAA